LRLRLTAVLAVLAALLVSSVAFGASSSARLVKKPKPVPIKVTLSDYSFKFSKPAVKILNKKKGVSVLFTVHNAGTVQHNMDLVGYKRTAILSPGKTVKLLVTFKKKASIQVVCDVPRHIQLGMVSSFKVK